MVRPRAADDFAAIHARMKELRRERLQAAAGEPVIYQTNEPGPSPDTPIGQVVLKLLQKHRRQLR